MAEEVRRLTPGGEGVAVAYDSVGRDTALHSLACVRPRGALVLYGNASGPPPDIAPLALAEQGSVYMARPKLHDFLATEEETAWRGAELFGHPEGPHAGEPVHVLEPTLQATLPLEGAEEGHRMIEGRQTTGKILFEI
uniref:Quinone oxidoreductase n=1 Tax=Hemiselmis tepida TaxID=464990 RepID=A0A7S0WAC8_9CRYP